MTGNSQPFYPFVRLWLGQLLSLVGSAMTRFALSIYVWQTTGEATPVVLIGVFAALPAAIVTLWAGVLVDRSNRKRTLMLADLGSACGTVMLLVFITLNSLQLWQIYLAVAVVGICNTFQWLAFSSTLSSLVAKQDLDRANGMLSLAEYIALVGAPLLAGVLLPFVTLQGVLILDIISFSFAVLATAITTIPPHGQPTPQPEADSEGFFGSLSYGFRYILEHRPLAALLGVVFIFSAFEALGYTLLTPMILARSGGSESTLGAVQAVMGIGGILGGTLISTWGGFRRRMHGLLIGIALTGLFGDALMGLGQGLVLWLIAGFAVEFSIPLVISSHRGIWQSKVSPGAQGRIFATLGFVVGLSEPLASILSSMLADRVLEPAMRSGSGWLVIFGPWVGSGPGAGMALLFVFSGLILGLVGIVGMFTPMLRNLEQQLPDFDNLEVERTP